MLVEVGFWENDNLGKGKRDEKKLSQMFLKCWDKNIWKYKVSLKQNSNIAKWVPEFEF
jgi:hypothetical protein